MTKIYQKVAKIKQVTGRKQVISGYLLQRFSGLVFSKEPAAYDYVPDFTSAPAEVLQTGKASAIAKVQQGVHDPPCC
jgi:hypothetical protein